MIHLIINLVLIYICVRIYKDIKQKEKDLAEGKPVPYEILLRKLHYITNMSELQLFHEAAKEKNWPEYHVEDDFSKYLKRDCDWVPPYVKSFLDDGRQAILEAPINKWIIWF